MKSPPPETVRPWLKVSLKMTVLFSISGTWVSVHTLWFCGPELGTVTQTPSLRPRWPMPPPSPVLKLPQTQFPLTS